MARGLNPQQRKFVTEYLVDFNASAAADRAGYSTANHSVGTYLMNQPRILDEVRRRCLAIQTRLELTADDVRSGFARIATDPREQADGGPSWEARIVAFRELGKLMGLYVAKIHVTGTLTLEDLLLAAERKRAELPKVAEGVH